MNTQTLTAALEVAAASARQDLCVAPRDGRARWAHISETSKQPFVDEILRTPSLAEMEGLWYVVPYGSGVLNAKAYASYLVDRAVDTDAQSIVDDLMRFAEDRTIELVSVRSVEGVEVGAVVELGDGYSLMPSHCLPDILETRVVFSERNKPRHGWGNAPSAAIVLKEKFLVPLVEPPIDGMVAHSLDRSSVETDMQTALYAATLASAGAPDFRQAYDFIASCGWPGMSSGSMYGVESFPVMIPRSQPVDVDRVGDIFQKLRQMRGKLDLAIHKLQAGRRRSSFIERAVDLGTCIEVLLMHGSNDNAEIGHKIATRAAWLLGRDGEDRVAIFNRARELYTARSKAVHTGLMPKAKGTSGFMDTYLGLAAHDQLCAAVIVRLAELGKWPDWTRLVLDAR